MVNEKESILLLLSGASLDVKMISQQLNIDIDNTRTYVYRLAKEGKIRVTAVKNRWKIYSLVHEKPLVICDIDNLEKKKTDAEIKLSMINEKIEAAENKLVALNKELMDKQAEIKQSETPGSPFKQSNRGLYSRRSRY
jgi:predicted  nucleic acid-binding Zn-ribbon protein